MEFAKEAAIKSFQFRSILLDFQSLGTPVPCISPIPVHLLCARRTRGMAAFHSNPSSHLRVLISRGKRQTTSAHLTVLANAASCQWGGMKLVYMLATTHHKKLKSWLFGSHRKSFADWLPWTVYISLLKVTWEGHSVLIVSLIHLNINIG